MNPVAFFVSVSAAGSRSTDGAAAGLQQLQLKYRKRARTETREEAVGSSPSEEQKLWMSEKCKPHQLTCAEVSV